MKTWLDIMPAIPLARGVPVFNKTLGPGRGARDVVCGPGEGADYYLTVGSSRRNRGQTHGGMMRVDLADPQGFGYALRWYGHQPVSDGGALFRRLRDAYFLDVHDADRLVLARACAEVAR
ncbi:MAG: hypothetical protein ABIL09_19670 [Gemmatimonadota bacterium]